MINLTGLSKRYARHAALSDVNLQLPAGRVHALMGENGAGKSTLIKLIAGVVAADQMHIEIDGQAVSVSSPAQAYQAGFRFIHQELNIVPQLSVAENILLHKGLPRRWGIAIDWASLKNQAQQALWQLGVDHVDVSRQAGQLASGDRMLISIASALVAEPDNTAILYVLDEPTAALTGVESERLFQVIARLKKQGAAVLYVSHRMNEVLQLCDDVTVLRDGCTVFESTMQQTNRHQLISAMTGRHVEDAFPPRVLPVPEEPYCHLEGVCSNRLRNISFTLNRGEILGVCGLAESGQSEVLRLFLGLEPIKTGSLTLQGGPPPRSPNQAWSEGVAYVPRERRHDALMLGRSVSDNTVVSHLSLFGMLSDRRHEHRLANQLAHTVSLKARNVLQNVGELSGGNQQKVVFARAIGRDPKLLLLDEPTRGVDVGAKFDIYTLLRQLSHNGCTIIMTGSDLPELLGMCDKLLILIDGSPADIVSTANMTPAALLDTFYDPVH